MRNTWAAAALLHADRPRCSNELLLLVDEILPTEAESNWHIVHVPVSAKENMIPAGFSKELTMPLSTKSYSGSNIHSGFVY